MDNWKYRRRVIFATLVFMAVTLSFGIFTDNTSMITVLAPPYSLLATTIIGWYVFGAVWDDQNNKLKRA